MSDELKPFIGIDPAFSGDTTTTICGYSKNGVVHIVGELTGQQAEDFYKAWNTRADTRKDDAIRDLVDKAENISIAIGMGWDLEGSKEALDKVLTKHKDTIEEVK